MPQFDQVLYRFGCSSNVIHQGCRKVHLMTTDNNNAFSKLLQRRQRFVPMNNAAAEYNAVDNFFPQQVNGLNNAFLLTIGILQQNIVTLFIGNILN